MRYFHFSTIWGGILLLLSIYPLSAQTETTTRTQRADTLRRELLVVSDQEVQIEQALPLHSKFEFDKPKLTKLKPLPPRSTGDFTPPVIVPRHPMLSDLAAQVPSSKRYGYLQLAAGADPNVRLQGGYSRLFAEKHQLDIHLSHYSKQHNTPLSNDKISLVKRHVSDAWLGYSLFGSKGTFTVQAQGAYDFYNYFALNPLVALGSSLFTTPLSVGEDYEKVQLSYQTTPAQKVNASVDFAYEHTGLAVKNRDVSPNRVEEQRVLLDARFQGKRSESLFIGVDFSTLAQFTHSRNTPLQHKRGENLSHGMALSEIVPHIEFSTLLGTTRWNVYAGGGIGFLTTRKNNAYFYPKVSTSLTFSKNVQLFARAEGGAKALSRHELGKVNRFIDPHQVISPSIYTLDAELGIRTYWGYGVSLDLSGGYQILPNMTFLAPDVTVTDPQKNSFVAFVPLYDKMNSWYLKGVLSYALGEKLQFSLSSLFHNYKTEKLSVAEGLPTWSLEGEALYRWNERLSFSVRTKLHYGIRYSITPEQKYSVQDLLLRGQYRLNKRWSIYGEIKNPIFGASEYPFGYRDFYPIAGMIGATMLF
ncbi:TonB-dependent receptor [Porphyromonas circumdentaria]|nr:hypothetical protein [Porphyromonas circumdentaria]MBB6276275.1 hypothetical protein [Porphyromonas circumdentaria]